MIRPLSWGLIVGAGVLVVGIAFARGPLIDASGSPASTSGGSGGVAIGDAVGGGTAGRILYEGAGPVLADSEAMTFVPPGAGQFVTLKVRNPQGGTALSYSTLYATNVEDAYAIVQTSHGNDTDSFGLPTNNQAFVGCNTGADCVFANYGAGALRFAYYRTLIATMNDNVQFHRQIARVNNVPTAFTKGHCTLNGSNPSQCSVGINSSPYGGDIECVCSIKSATHKGACAVNLSGTTLTATTDNGITDDVSFICW